MALRDILTTGGFVSLLGGLLVLSVPTMTGSVIGGLNQSSNSILGAILLAIGLGALLLAKRR
jgi:hypothetical protein